MPCQGKKKKHTPIVSKKQRGLMGAELRRRREGKKSKIPSMTTKELESHLHESKGKKLPMRTSYKKGVHGSGPFSDEDFAKGYRTLEGYDEKGNWTER